MTSQLPPPFRKSHAFKGFHYILRQARKSDHNHHRWKMRIILPRNILTEDLQNHIRLHRCATEENAAKPDLEKPWKPAREMESLGSRR
ncbi:hypothetical protein YC2023_059657 [Brassica napus]